MRVCLCKTVFCRGAGLLLAVMLISCSPDSEPVRAKKPEITAPQYTASDYVKHLALAELMPDKRKDSLKIINMYLQQKAKEPEHQTVLRLEYKRKKSKAMQQIAAPISRQGEDDTFPALREIMKQLANKAYILHNLQIAVVDIAPNKQLLLDEKDDEAIDFSLEVQERLLFKDGVALSTTENIRMEMRLIRFFIRHRFRDAAYLMADNAKESLALLTQNGSGDMPEAEELTQELERLESEMRKVMPFSF